MRTPAILLALSLLAAPAFADDADDTGPLYEPQTYRFGGTYLSEPAYSTTGCARVCGQDPFCKSWSYLKFEGAAGSGTCELKHTIGAAEPNPSSTSGISPRIEARYPTGRGYRPAELLGASNTRVRTVFAEPVASVAYTPAPGPSAPTALTAPSIPQSATPAQVTFEPVAAPNQGSTDYITGSITPTNTRDPGVYQNGERVPYADLAGREYPAYSVTRAAAQDILDKEKAAGLRGSY